MCIIFLAGLFLICISVNTRAISQDFYWRDFIANDIPHDAIEGDKGKYIGQVVYKNYILPATIYPHRHFPAVALYGERLQIKDNIKILCAPDPSKFYWKSVNFSTPDVGQLKGAVKGGYQNEYNLLIGKANHDGEWKIGKVMDISNNEYKGLWLWDQNGKQVQIFNFDLLKYNSTVAPHYCEQDIGHVG